MILTYFLHNFAFFQRKQNSKVYTSKNPHAQLWSSHANTGRKEVTVANQRQKNDMTKSVFAWAVVPICFIIVVLITGELPVNNLTLQFLIPCNTCNIICANCYG